MSIGIPFYRKIQSDLDLNGPTLSMQRQPVGTSCTVASGIATFIGIGTAIFPPGQTGRKTNTGSITHQWHKVGVGALSDGTNVTGSGTTTLTLSGLTSPTDDGSEYFCRIGYTPNSLSPNAVNEPFDSASAELTVVPTFSITSQPSDFTTIEGNDATFSVVATASDNNTNFSYQWVLDDVDLSDGTVAGTGVVSGSKTDTLTISRTDAALYRLFCRVSNSDTNPGIVTSSLAKLDVSVGRALLKFERYSQGVVTVEAEERDIAKMGGMSFRADADRNARIICVWAPEEDVDVKVTVGGAAGAARNGNRGGTGGISVFRTTLIRNEEYIIKLGVNYEQGGGPRGGINGGGGISAIYHKAKMIAVAGGGGGAGTNGRGGDGGGLQVAGEDGQGASSGQGGVVIQQGQLPVYGMTQAGRTGIRDFDNGSSGSGRISGCTVGADHWTSRFSPCDDIGNTKMNNVDGSTISNSTTLLRGYKPGQGHRNNGGAGSGNQGGGGAGGRGGQGATNNGSGGGGASGYASDEVELLPSSELPTGTQLGGNDDVAFICFETFVVTDDHTPCIPPKSNSPNSLRTVHFAISREAAFSNVIVFRKQSGNGPDTLTFGPNGGTVSAQIASGAVYTLLSHPGKLRLSGNTLQLEDSTDDDYNDLQITPDRGTFTSSSRYVA
tara:strand:+ start:4911 stop:6908 length:1998 start_codon:yes stop_codon:yes gene_type:complete